MEKIKSGPSKQFKLHRNSNYPCSNYPWCTVYVKDLNVNKTMFVEPSCEKEIVNIINNLQIKVQKRQWYKYETVKTNY